VGAGLAGDGGVLFHLRTHELLAVGFQIIEAGVVENLHIAQRVLAGLAAALAQIGLGAGEVIVLDDRRPRLHALRAGQVPAGLFAQPGGLAAVLVAHRQRCTARAGLTGADRVGQHQGVLAGLVREVVVDALLLHQPGQEVEIALAVLHAVDPGREAGGGAIVDAGDGVLAQHLLDDLQHGLVLEDLAVLGLRQEPEPGPGNEQVLEVAPALADQRDLFDQTVEVARRVRDIGVLVQAHGDVFAQQSVEVQIGPGAQAQHREGEGLAERLLGRQLTQQQVRAKRTVQFCKMFHRAA
jgi:hypothetical protein